MDTGGETMRPLPLFLAPVFVALTESRGVWQEASDLKKPVGTLAIRISMSSSANKTEAIQNRKQRRHKYLAITHLLFSLPPDSFPKFPTN
jgi:hypothetical protein